MAPSLAGSVCLVTGACRGIGRGIALQLGDAGATVYITGRTKDSLDETAKEIAARGGKPVTVQMDHGVDKDVEALFVKIRTEQNNRLDVLVNNAYAGVTHIFENKGKKFWDSDPVQAWDCINGVGLRGHYICTVLASRIMVENKRGLIVNVSSIGGLRYLFNVAYGVGKAGCDRMAADCAIELKSSGVTMVSLWPGAVKTELIVKNFLEKEPANAEEEKATKMFEKGESVEFAGKSIRYLAADGNVINKTGKILMTLELAKEYGFVDIDGSLPMDYRQLNTMLAMNGHTWMASILPNFIKIPLLGIHMGSYKF